MAKIFQRMFLSKNKIRILDMIENNADKITYDYYEHSYFPYHEFTIKTPTSVLTSTSTRDRYLFSRTYISQYNFAETLPNGTVHEESEEFTPFANRVHSAMFRAFIKAKSIEAIHKKQEDFLKKQR